MEACTSSGLGGECFAIEEFASPVLEKEEQLHVVLNGENMRKHIIEK